jgi:hypothetical protein
VGVLGQQQFSGQLDFGRLAAEVAQEPTLFFDLRKKVKTVLLTLKHIFSCLFHMFSAIQWKLP